MKQYLQNTLIKNLSDSGCYFLCLCEVASRFNRDDVNIIREALFAIDNGWMTNEFYVKDPKKILEHLTFNAVKWRVEFSDTTDEKAYADVEKWFNARTGFSHFRLTDWDSLKDSITVKEGIIMNHRLIYKD